MFILFLILTTYNIIGSVSNYSTCCPASTLKDNTTFCESGSTINLFCVENDTEIVYDLIKYEYEISKCPSKDTKICKSEMKVKDAFENVSVVCKTDLKKCIKSEKWWETFVIKEKTVTILYQLIKFMSIILLLITSITYVVISRLNDVHGICLRHHSFTLAIAFVAIAIENSYTYPDSSLICIFQVYVIIYFVIASFGWLNLTFYTTWRCINNIELSSESYDKRAIAYRTIGYGIIPGITIFASCITVFIRHRNDDATSPCLKHQLILIGFWYIPILITLLVNVFYFCDTSRRLHEVQNDVISHTTLQYKHWLNFKLLVAAGLTWMIYGFFGFLHVKSFWVNVILNVLFSSLGVVVFILLVVLRKNVLQNLFQTIHHLWTSTSSSSTVDETQANS